MADTFASDSLITSARSAFAITKSDETNYLTGAGLRVPRALYVGTAGSVVVQLVGDSGTVTFAGVPAGAVLPIRPQRVLAATTASDIVGLV
ncbi:MAG: hypothetical protein RL756_2288 [Pseudomonadota bacterium]|jgi:hypothetical protein